MKQLYIIILMGVFFCSCESYLDIKPYDRTIPETAEDFSALVHNMCDGFDRGTSEAISDCSETVSLEAVSDNMATNLADGSDRLRIYIGQDLSMKQNTYKNLYAEIKTCNIILGEFEDGRDTREGQDIVGTAYAVRGVCYYQLLRMFCEPPLADATKPGVPIVTEFDMEAWDELGPIATGKHRRAIVDVERLMTKTYGKLEEAAAK